MLASRSLWVHQRIQALDGRQGFVSVPTDLAALYVAAGWASRVFNPWARRAPPDAPFVDVASLTVTPTPGTVTAASPIGTVAATLAASGGTAPYTYALSDTDNGNFAIDGATVETAKTGITAGAHTVKVIARDSSNPAKWSAATTVNITVAAAPGDDDPVDAQTVATFHCTADLAHDAPVGTHVGTIRLLGVEPYTFSWIDNDGGNFRRSGTDIFTNASPLSVGVHGIAVRVTDGNGHVSEITAAIDVTG